MRQSAFTMKRVTTRFRILLGLRIGLGVAAVGDGNLRVAAAIEKISMRAWSLT